MLKASIRERLVMGFTLLVLVGGLLAVAVPVMAATGGGQVLVTVRSNPLTLTVEASPQAGTGSRFVITAVASNIGPFPLKQVKATLHPPKDLELELDLEVRGNPEANLGTLRPGMSKEKSWRVRTEVPGNYVILVTVAAVEDETEDTVTAQDTVIHSVP